MAIEMVKVRALIDIGEGNMMIGTPPLGYANHILSFNVDRARGQVASFSASMKVRRDEVSGGLLDNASVVIYAGSINTYLRNKIFTGAIKTATVSPNRDDPEFVILNISGNDILNKLNGKKYTRRCRSTKGVWVSIDNVSRTGLRDGKLTYDATQKYLGTWGGELFKEDKLTSTRVPLTDENVELVKENISIPEIVLDIHPVEAQ